MHALRSLVVIAVLYVAVGHAGLRAQHLGASVRIGTGGVGAGLAGRVTNKLSARVDASYFSHSFEGLEELDKTLAEYNGDGSLLFVSALADWHPFGNVFRLSFGGMYNAIEGGGGAVPVEHVELGINSYSPEEIGHLNVDVRFDPRIAPYVGVGFGNSVAHGLGFLLDIGVIYVGSPNIRLNASGMLSPTESQAAQIEQNLEWIQWYPLISIGVRVGL